MSFKSLYKLYLMNNYETFNSIYLNKLNSDSTIKFDIKINGYDAFFTYDKEIMSLVSEIRELDRKLTSLIGSVPQIFISQYMRKSMIEEIEFTNKIEGVMITKKEISDLINEIEKNIKSNKRFKGIVNKYLALLDGDFVLKNFSDIRKIYDAMLYDEVKNEDESLLPDGVIFRKEEVEIYKSGIKAVHKGVMPEGRIIEYLDKALDILNDKNIDVLIRVSIFHYLFGYIHPFYDGNGRLNRFITSYVISRYLNSVIGFRLSSIINENINKYMNVFNETNDIRNRGDISLFVYNFLVFIRSSVSNTINYILLKKDVFDYYNRKIDFINGINKLEKETIYILLQTAIFGGYGLTKSNIGEIINRGATTVTSVIIKLNELSLLDTYRNGRYYYYKLDLNKLDEFEW